MFAIGLLPCLWTAWILWAAPLDGLTAARSALAARDFTALWAAGQAAATGTLAVLANPGSFTAYLRDIFGAGIPDQIWPYPPPILLIARPLAALPFMLGFALYTALGLAALLLASRSSSLSRLQRAAILLSPAVATNALTGQTGALISAMLLGGLLLIDRRPVLAGVLLGALIIKPQFAVILPICLVAGSRWKTAFAGCASAIVLAFSSVIVFGLEPWVEFLLGQKAVSAYVGAPWQSDSAQSIFTSAFMAARSLGADLSLAYAVQVSVTVCCAYSAWRLWRAPNLSAKALTVATLPLVLLAAPWVHTYDMPALAVAVVMMLPVEPGWRRSALAFAWLWPGLSQLISIPPSIAVLSVASVAWLASWYASPLYRASPWGFFAHFRHMGAQPRPTSHVISPPQKLSETGIYQPAFSPPSAPSKAADPVAPAEPPGPGPSMPPVAAPTMTQRAMPSPPSSRS